MTVTVNLSPIPILQFFGNGGQPLAGGYLLTQVGGVNYATYQDPTGSTPLPNPIPLNSRGEISNASGTTCELYLATGVSYTLTLYDGSSAAPPYGNQIWQAPYIGGSSTVFASASAFRAASVVPTLGSIVIYSADGGEFIRDPSDTTSAENGGSYCGTVLRSVDYATNGVWKRVYSGGLNIRWFGASTSLSDNAAAIVSTIAAASTSGVKGSVYVPAGTWNVSTYKPFVLTSVNTGMKFYGDGKIVSTINYTNNTAGADNFLFYHDEVSGGTCREVVFEDMQFTASGGAAGNQGFEYMHSTGTPSGGSGLFAFINCYFSGWKVRHSFAGTAACDTHTWYKCSGRESGTVLLLNNQNSVIHGFFDCDEEQPVGSSGVMFDQLAGGEIHWYGGYIAGELNGIIVYTEATGTYGPAVNLLFDQVHIEMYGNSQFFVDAADFGMKNLMLRGCAFTQVDTPANNQFIIRTGARVEIRDSYIWGAINMTSIATSYQLRNPMLLMDCCEWVGESLVQSFTGDLNKPIVRIINRSPLYPGSSKPDYESGPFMSGHIDVSRRVKTWIIASYGATTDATPQLPLPGAGAAELTVVFGDYTSIRKFRLVVGSTNSTGGNLVYVVKDGGGSTLATFTIPNTTTAAVYETNVEQTQFNVTGNAKTCVLSCTTNTGNQVVNGYLEIEYI